MRERGWYATEHKVVLERDLFEAWRERWLRVERRNDQLRAQLHDEQRLLQIALMQLADKRKLADKQHFARNWLIEQRQNGGPSGRHY